MLKKLAVLSAFAVGSLGLAHATPISQISIDGNDSFTVSGNTGSITFYNPASVGGAPTGAFSAFNSSDTDVTLFPTYATTSPAGCTAMCNPSGPLPFTLGTQTVQMALGMPSVLALTTTEGSNSLDFYMTSYAASTVSGTAGCSQDCLDFTGNGFFTVDGGSPVNGSFTFTSQATDTLGDTEVTFSATGAETPEPTSLLLLGTGLLGVGGIARRKLVRA